VALLGFELPTSEALYELVNGAEVVVVEFAEDADWTLGRVDFEALLSHISLKPVIAIRLDLTGNDLGDFVPPQLETEKAFAR